MKPLEKVTFEEKDKLYKYMNVKLVGLIGDEPDWLANLSNASALLWLFIDNINWAGFYLMKNGKLVLGPFQGKPACINIELGKGVCGTAAETRKTQLVKDVHEFPGHIACDGASQSEIVVPIIVNGEVLGVLDIDSPITDRFNEEDKAGLERLTQTLVKYVDWESVKNR